VSALFRRTTASPRKADAGFAMVEMMVSLVIIAIVMTAAIGFFINGLRSENGQRQRQEAVYLADQQMQTVQAIPASDLVQGRSSTVQAAALTSSLGTSLNLAAQSDVSSNASFDGNTSDSMLIPMSLTQTVNKVPYTISTFVYACHLTRGINGTCGATNATGSTQELRVTVATSWTSNSNCSNGCHYATSTLIDPNSDQTFNTNISAPTGSITSPSPAVFFNDNTGVRGTTPYETCTTGPTGNQVTVPGTEMIITGTALKSNIRVWIAAGGGSIPTNTIYQPSATEIDVCVQTGDVPGTYTISVINTDGGHFQTSIVENPVIRWVAQTGSGASQTLTMNGGGFVTGATFAATGGVSGNFTVVSATQATLTSYVGPSAGASPAPLLTLTDPAPGGQRASFTLPAMSTTTTPSSVAVGRLVTVSLTGAGFESGLATTSVTNGTATATFISAGSATVNVQAAAVGAMSFALINPDGGVSNTISLTVDPLPTVVAPGSKLIGSTWNLTGTGFLPGMTASITGGDAVTVNSLTGSTSASLTVTGSTSGTFSLTLTNVDGGTVTTPITILPLPAVTGRTTGVSGQIAVVLTGTNFQTGITVIDSNGTLVSTTRNSATQLTLMLSDAASVPFTHNLTLTNPDGGVTTTTAVVDPPLDITTVPASITAGAQFTVGGTGFMPGLTVSSTKSGTPTVTYVSSTSVLVTLPTAGAQTFTLTNPDGGHDAATVTPIAVSTPNITSVTLTPDTSPTRNTTSGVIVSGTGFVSGATFTAEWTRSGTATTDPTPTSVVFVNSGKETFNVLVPPTKSTSSKLWTLTVTITNPDGGTDTFAKSGITVS
jgi:prepilin-type N-terminal cleavage/methylation domain-containing protein